MSTKQARKRKNRQNARERTVTTLIQDPGTHFIPAPEDSAANPMSPAFSIGSASASSAGLPAPPAGFHPHGNYPGFAFNSNYVPSMNGQQQGNAQHPPQQPPSHRNHVPDHSISTGNSDLDRLERLKREILEGQNPYYKAIPQPDILESLFLGRASQGQPAVPAHPDQVVNVAKPAALPQQLTSYASRFTKDSPSAVPGEAIRTAQSSQNWDSTITADVPNTQPGNSSAQGMPTRGNAHSQVQSRFDNDSMNNHSTVSKAAADARTNSQANSPLISLGMSNPARVSKLGGPESTDNGKHLGQAPATNQQNTRNVTDKGPPLSGESMSHRQPGHAIVSAKNSTYDGREDPRRPGDGARGDGSPEDKHSRRPGNMYPGHRSEPSRFSEPRYPDARYYDRERDKERERDSERERDRERDRDRDRRPDYRQDEKRPEDQGRIAEKRPPIPPDSRDLRPQDNRRFISRPTNEPVEGDNRRQFSAIADAAVRPLEDRISRTVIVDERQPQDVPGDGRLERAPPLQRPVGDHPIRALTLDDRQPRPSPGDDRARLPTADDRTARTMPSLEGRLNRPSKVLEERIQGRAPLALEERIGDRVPPPLEERIGARQTPTPEDRNNSRPPPALQERIGGRPPPLEGRIGNRPPTAAIDDRLRSIVPDSKRVAPDDRLNRPSDDRPSRALVDERLRPPELRGSMQDAHSSTRQNERPGILSTEERFSRPGTSDDSAPLPHSGYVPDSRPSPALRDSPRVSHTSARAISPRRLDSHDIRSHEDYRDRIDSRSGVAPYRTDLDRRYNDDRRVDVEPPGQYPLRSLPFRERDPIPVDDSSRASLAARQWRERDPYPPPSMAASDVDRRYPPPPLDSREWLPASDDRAYRNSWDRDGPPPRDPERDRYIEHESVKGAWDAGTRDDRRSSAPPPPRSWDRDEPLSRPPGTRPPDFNPADDRAPRDLERARYPPNDFVRTSSRVRPRSPSPVRRGPGVEDDLRPVKRPRDDLYYDAGDRRVPPPAEYHPRGASPPVGGTGSFFEPRTATYTPRDIRDPVLALGGRSTDPGFYDRPMPPPRSPPYNARATYARNDGRDDRRYSMPPPRTA